VEVWPGTCTASAVAGWERAVRRLSRGGENEEKNSGSKEQRALFKIFAERIMSEKK
jgi:hypothetical protein